MGFSDTWRGSIHMQRGFGNTQRMPRDMRQDPFDVFPKFGNM